MLSQIEKKGKSVSILQIYPLIVVAFVLLAYFVGVIPDNSFIMVGPFAWLLLIIGASLTPYFSHLKKKKVVDNSDDNLLRQQARMLLAKGKAYQPHQQVMVEDTNLTPHKAL